MAKVAILIHRDPIIMEVDEDLSEEEVTAMVETTEGFAGWEYEEPWRN